MLEFRPFFLILSIFLLASLLSADAAAQARDPIAQAGGLTAKGRQLLEGGRLTEQGRKRLGLEQDDADLKNLPPPKVRRVCPPGETLAGEPCEFTSLAAVQPGLVFNTRILLAPGVYRECLTISRNHVTLEGPGAVLSGTACAGKAAMVISGNFVTIRGIGCTGIAVRSRNGACVRQEGFGLTLDGVDFHDSQEGLLAGGRYGDLTILGSTFRTNGEGGRAHQVYFGPSDARLVIRDSEFIAAVGEGHGVKSGARETILERVVIDGTGGFMSRNVDAYNGGILHIRDSTLVKAPSDANNQIIGYDYEGRADFAVNEIVVENSRIDCGRAAYILDGKNSLATAKVTFRANTVTGNCLDRARWGL